MFPDPTPAKRRVPCVGALVHDDDGRLLVVRRAHEPGRGLWSVPGGRVEPGESDPVAVEREVLEETGLHVTVGIRVGTVVRDGPGGSSYDIRDYACIVAGPTEPGAGRRCRRGAVGVPCRAGRAGPRRAALGHARAVGDAAALSRRPQSASTRSTAAADRPESQPLAAVPDPAAQDGTAVAVEGGAPRARPRHGPRPPAGRRPDAALRAGSCARFARRARRPRLRTAAGGDAGCRG